MMTSSDQTEMTDGVDCGGTRWTGCLDARAVERFCSELEQVRLIVVRASRRLATHCQHVSPAVRRAYQRMGSRVMLRWIPTPCWLRHRAMTGRNGNGVTDKMEG